MHLWYMLKTQKYANGIYFYFESASDCCLCCKLKIWGKEKYFSFVLAIHLLFMLKTQNMGKINIFIWNPHPTAVYVEKL